MFGLAEMTRVDISHRYKIKVEEYDDHPGVFSVTFLEKGMMQARMEGMPSKAVPFHSLIISSSDEGLLCLWSQSPEDASQVNGALEAEAKRRVSARLSWIARVRELIAFLERWASELGWSTRRIEKNLDDSLIGKHRVPALLMQEETFRVLVESVGASTPGSAGRVDLYWLPAYDDIATLLSDESGGWTLHYSFAEASNGLDAALDLTKENLNKVLEEMRAHAASL